MEYMVGDLVFLKILPYRQVSFRKRRNEKLSSKFFSPYKIIERIGPVAYKLELPKITSIHPVFHVPQLKMLGNHQVEPTDMPYMTETYEWRAVPDETYGYLKNKSGGWDVLISWKGLPRHKATWEAYEKMQRLFLEFYLEDKVNLEKECNDRPPIIHQYTRRGKKN